MSSQWPPRGPIQSVAFVVSVTTPEGAFHRHYDSVAELRAAVAEMERTVPGFPRRPVRALPQWLGRWLLPEEAR